MQDAGDDAVDGEFLGVTEAHQRHGVVGHVEVSDVVQLNVSQAALSQELTTQHSTRQCMSTTRTLYHCSSGTG